VRHHLAPAPTSFTLITPAVGTASQADRAAQPRATQDRATQDPAPQDPALHDPAGPEVEVRVLGPVEVWGAARAFERAWTLELVVYLALHPRGVSSEAWATALWPDRLMAPPTLHSTVSAARRSLGRSRQGWDHLPRRHGALQLAPTVTTDWRRLCDLAGTPDPRAWQQGLSLVRGRPFDGLRSPDWSVLEGIAAEVEEGVVQLAIRVADQCLVAGDGRGAALAARRGLLVSPYDERLYRLLLRAADLQGNPAGVESAMAELVHLVGGTWRRPSLGRRMSIANAAAYVHPDTAALYGELSRRPPAAAGREFARL